MICNFRTWQILEHLGDGTETFSQDLDIYGKYKNLDIYSPYSSWEVEDGKGKITYRVSIDTRNAGIEDIKFEILEIEISLEIREESSDSDKEGEIAYRSFLFDKSNIDNPTIVVKKLPFFLNSLSLNFSQAENLDGEINLKKVKIEMEIGGDED